MNIRQAKLRDWKKIEELHKQQPFEYKLPNRKEFDHILLLVDENDNIQMVLGAKKVIEYNLLIKPNIEISPFLKWNYIKMLANKSLSIAKIKGFSQVFVWLPPEILKSFGRRMLKLGGKQFTWPCFGKEI